MPLGLKQPRSRDRKDDVAELGEHAADVAAVSPVGDSFLIGPGEMACNSSPPSGPSGPGATALRAASRHSPPHSSSEVRFISLTTCNASGRFLINSLSFHRVPPPY